VLSSPGDLACVQRFLNAFLAHSIRFRPPALFFSIGSSTFLLSPPRFFFYSVIGCSNGPGGYGFSQSVDPSSHSLLFDAMTRLRLLLFSLLCFVFFFHGPVVSLRAGACNGFPPHLHLFFFLTVFNHSFLFLTISCCFFYRAGFLKRLTPPSCLFLFFQRMSISRVFFSRKIGRELQSSFRNTQNHPAFTLCLGSNFFSCPPLWWLRFVSVIVKGSHPRGILVANEQFSSPPVKPPFEGLAGSRPFFAFREPSPLDRREFDRSIPPLGNLLSGPFAFLVDSPFPCPRDFQYT